MARTIKPISASVLIGLTLLLSVILGGLVSWAVTSTGTGQQFETWTQDLRLRQRPLRDPSPSVVIVGSTDTDLDDAGQWRISRGGHAYIASILQEAQARQITFDYLFSEPSNDPAADQHLKNTFEGIPALTLGYNFGGSESQIGSGHFAKGSRYGVELNESLMPAWDLPQPPFTQMAIKYGAVNVPEASDDEVIRKIPLFLRYEGKLYPSLVMQSLMNGLGVSEDQIRIHLGESIEIVDTPRGHLSIPIDENAQFTVNFHAHLESFSPAYSYSDLYTTQLDDELDYQKKIYQSLAGKFILVGDLSTGTSDVKITPLGRMSGVAVHALALSNILDGEYLRTWSKFQTVLFCITLSFICLLILGWLKKQWLIPILVVGAIAGLLFWALFQAKYDLLVPVVSPMATVILSSFVVLGGHLFSEKKARRRMGENFKPYLAAPLYRRLLQPVTHEKMASERRELSIFFSDIRGFTAWTEEREAEEITEVLNQYFETVIPIVEQFGGTLDKLMGDGMMVFFGAPEVMSNHAGSAIAMAWKMQEEILKLQERWQGEGRTPLSVGMAVHTGYVTVGNFGSNEFSDYTVIGGNVNMTARIEGQAPGGKILISERARACAGEQVSCADFKILTLKGISHPIPVFEVTGIEK